MPRFSQPVWPVVAEAGYRQGSATRRISNQARMAKRGRSGTHDLRSKCRASRRLHPLVSLFFVESLRQVLVSVRGEQADSQRISELLKHVDRRFLNYAGTFVQCRAVLASLLLLEDQTTFQTSISSSGVQIIGVRIPLRAFTCSTIALTRPLTMWVQFQDTR